jgi:hypothetical protein
MSDDKHVLSVSRLRRDGEVHAAGDDRFPVDNQNFVMRDRRSIVDYGLSWRPLSFFVSQPRCRERQDGEGVGAGAGCSRSTRSHATAA